MKRLIKFGFVGGCGTVVNLVVVWLCVQGGWPVELAVGAGIGVSIFSNYLLNSRWTWADREPLGVGRYYVLATGGAALQWSVAWLVRDVAAQHYLLASAVAIAVGAGTTFAGADRFVFARRSHAV